MNWFEEMEIRRRPEHLEGWAAFHAGKELSDNPFQSGPGVFAEAWAMGWMKAQKESTQVNGKESKDE